MRYRLSTLLVVTTLAAGAVALYLQHGWFGLWLLAPHVAAIAFCAYLITRGRRRIAATVAGVYFTCWLLTGWWGVASVCAEFEARFDDRANEHASDRAKTKRVEYLASFDPPFECHVIPRDEPPWYYLGGANAPCPFVVTFDYGVMNGYHVGVGERVYVVWLFGYDVYVTEALRWSSG